MVDKGSSIHMVKRPTLRLAFLQLKMDIHTSRLSRIRWTNLASSQNVVGTNSLKIPSPAGASMCRGSYGRVDTCRKRNKAETRRFIEECL